MSKPEGMRSSFFLRRQSKKTLVESSVDGSAKQKSGKVLLGKDFLSHWDEMDKKQSNETNRLKQVAALVRNGQVSQEVYEKLVRETKEKNLGISKNKLVKDEWIEKPVLKGFLYYRVRNKKGIYKWRKFYFTLYRARLDWKKKKNSTGRLGMLRLTKHFDLVEITPKSSKANASEAGVVVQKTNKSRAVDNKFQMRHAFQLRDLHNEYEFAAESDALKKYWFHTLGLTISRIIERSKMTDSPFLLTTRPKLQSMPDHVAQSVRESNYRTSIASAGKRSSLKTGQGSPMAAQRKQRPSVVDLMLEPDTSVSRVGIVVDDGDDDDSRLQKRPTKRVQYIPKQLVEKNPELLTTPPDDEQYDEDGLPLIEVGDRVEYSTREKGKRPQSEARTNIRSTLNSSAHNSEELDKIVPLRASRKRVKEKQKVNDHKLREVVVEQPVVRFESPAKKHGRKKSLEDSARVVDRGLGLKTRSPSFDDNLNISLKGLRKKLEKEEGRVAQANQAMDVVGAQEADLRETYETTKKESNDDEEIQQAKEAWKKAKEFEILQEELLAGASLKREELKQAIRKKEAAIAQSSVTRELVDEVAKNEEGDPIEAAKKVLKRNEVQQENIIKKTEAAHQAVKKAREREMQLMQDEEMTFQLRTNAATRSVELKAEELLEVAQRKRKEAQQERLEKEQQWTALVDESVSTRLKAFELKRALQKRLSSRRKEQALTGTKVNSKNAMADFIAQNAVANCNKSTSSEVVSEKSAVKKKKKPSIRRGGSKLAQFISAAVEGVDERDSFGEANPETNQENEGGDNGPETNQEGEGEENEDGEDGPENYQYEDFTESYYSDEAYPRVNELEFIENQSFQDELQTHNYFAEQTRHISEADKEELSLLWRDQEVNRLCITIRKIGYLSRDDQVAVTYEALAAEYESISDGLNGILVRAKASGRVDYEGDFILAEESAAVIITLLEE